MSDAFDVGRIQLHLPSGAATIHGFIRGIDATPVPGEKTHSGHPVWMGGSWRLFEGLPPMRRRADVAPVVDLRYGLRGFDHYGFGWAGVTTSDVSAKAERLGWRLITRRQAAALLAELGYHIPPRHSSDGTPYVAAVLWDDQLDDLTWHVSEAVDGFRFTYERSVFVCRDAPEPLIAHAALPPAS